MAEQEDGEQAMDVDDFQSPTDPALGDLYFPQIQQNSSMEEHATQPYNGSDSSDTTYQIITDGLQKGKEKLADSNGYTYTVKTQQAYGNRTCT